MITEFAPSLYVIEGPTVTYFGMPHPTRMAVIRLADETAWVWSPIPLTDEITAFMDTFKSVKHIVSPNHIHHLFFDAWHERWPDALLHASPKLSSKRSDLQFATELGDSPDSAWAEEIDQVIFRGSFYIEEVVFFHRESRTAIFCDLIQRHTEESLTGWQRLIMRAGGIVGKNGGTVRDLRFSFLRHDKPRVALEKVLNWNPERLLIAHGEYAQSGATAIISRALSWI